MGMGQENVLEENAPCATTKGAPVVKWNSAELWITGLWG